MLSISPLNCFAIIVGVFRIFMIKDDGSPMSADEIIKSSPVTADLGDQKDIDNAKEKLKDRFGDWENEPDPELRAKSAAKFVQYTEYIDNLNLPDGSPNPNAGNGDISGITDDGDARHGTKAGVFKDGAEQGMGYIQRLNGCLPTTSDSHVKEDATNEDDLPWGLKQAGKVLNFLPLPIGRLLTGLGNSIEEKSPSAFFSSAIGGDAEL